MFAVRWIDTAGVPRGHALIATRILGKMVILDRTGDLAASLGQLRYSNIATATLDEMLLVQKAGDSLAKISKAVYGSEKHWRLVHQANRDKLGSDPHNPSALRSGMELEIPVSASSRVWDEALPTGRQA
jgi:hypothetical protein